MVYGKTMREVCLLDENGTECHRVYDDTSNWKLTIPGLKVYNFVKPKLKVKETKEKTEAEDETEEEKKVEEETEEKEKVEEEIEEKEKEMTNTQTLEKEISDKQNEIFNETHKFGCVYVCRDSSNRYRIGDASKLLEHCRYTTSSVKPENKEKEKSFFSVLSIFSQKRGMSSNVITRPLSSNVWENVDQITRFHELQGHAANSAARADAISFTVTRNIYLYGFSIFGPRNQEEAEYKVDTILSRKRKDILMESTSITGKGVILPVVFERPVLVDRDCEHTLEVYIRGPESFMGASGQERIQCGPVMFRFMNSPKVKKNRTNVTKGQIPRLYFSFREK